MSAKATSFGEFLQTKRTEKKITIRKMGELVDLSISYLIDIEKGRRNPPDLAKLEKIAEVLELTTEEKETLMNLAGDMRETVAPDLPDYIRGRDYVAAALRTARDLDAGDEEWAQFVAELKSRKG